MPTIKRIMQRLFPGIVYWRRRAIAGDLRDAPVRDVFTRYYREQRWGDAASRCGPASTIEHTQQILRHLPSLLRSLNVRVMLDIPCGDFFWMRRLSLKLDHYIGADIVPEVVEENRRRFGRPDREFRVLDVRTDPLPDADLIFSRDCWVYLDNDAVALALANICRSTATYLIATTYERLTRNTNIVTGQWRPVNLERAPFHLPRPIRVIDEFSPCPRDAADGKSLGLWVLNDVRKALRCRRGLTRAPLCLCA